ncbi:MAG: hypothetical protein RBR87_09625 [Bacteroidales bacterium]|nr:hypothetical protein [Bacteroidales bacterium]
MKKIIALIDSFEQAEIVTDYAIRLAKDLKKELEIFHFFHQGQFWLDKRAKKQNPQPVKLVENTDSIVEKRSRILEKIISVKQASADLPFPLKYIVKQMSIYPLIRYLNKRDDFDLVVVLVSKTSKNDSILRELIENLKHPLYIFKIENV